MKSGYTFLGFIQNPDVGEDTLPLLYRGTKGYHVTLAQGLLNQSAGYGLTEDGKCERCGYNKCIRALEFHHLNPSEKDFGLSRCLTKNVKLLKAEADKCILLCSNCHAEIHQELYEQGYSQFKPDI